MFKFLILLMTVCFGFSAYSQTRSMEDIQRQQSNEYRRHMLNNPPSQEPRGSDPVDDAFGAIILELLRQQYARPQENPNRASPPDQGYSEAEKDQVITRIEAFLNDYHEVMTNDMESLGRFYADYVDYGNKGIVARRDIMAEKFEVEKICPSRNYKIDFNNSRLRPLPQRADHFELYFYVDTYCGGGKVQTNRVWENYLVLDLSEPDIKIMAVRGRAMTASR